MHMPINQSFGRSFRFRVALSAIGLSVLASFSACRVGDPRMAQEPLSIKGVVLCEGTREPLIDAYAALSVFTQKSLLEMGSYEEIEEVKVSSAGRFSFETRRLGAYQIEVREEPKGLPVGLITADESSELEDLVILVKCSN